MHITIKSFANIRDVLGGPEVAEELPEGSTLADLISKLSSKFGSSFDRQVRDQSTGEIVPFLILINNITYRSMTDLAVPVQDGDIVTIMIPFDGG
jgi:MoaD family protein